jgi:hypothetical protein
MEQKTRAKFVVASNCDKTAKRRYWLLSHLSAKKTVNRKRSGRKNCVIRGLSQLDAEKKFWHVFLHGFLHRFLRVLLLHGR